jgi:hypothetical protein
MTIHDAQQFRPRPRAAPAGPLPSADELREAIRDDGSSNHPLAVSACHASSLHRRRMADPALTAEIDTHRRTLITAIDMWVTRNVPTAHTGPTMHTEGIGPVVDRLAQRLVDAEHVTRSLPVNHSDARRARHRLDEISAAYDALVAEVLDGKRQLPRATARH